MKAGGKVTITCHRPLSPALLAALQAALAAPAVRIRPVTAGGETVWLKRVERLSLRWRLQKGGSRRAFAADRAGLRDLAAAGLPVVPIIAEGPDFLVTPAAGTPLSDLLAAGAVDPAIMVAAGSGLARLHRGGVAHGRPAARDILWDGAQVWFIDFERYRPGPAPAGRQARDMLALLHSLLKIRARPTPEVQAVLESWVAAAPPVSVAALWRQARWLRPWRPVVGWLQRRRPRSREFAAVAALLDWLGTMAPPRL